MAAKVTDAIIVGAGPAGLSAAIYMARYDRSCVVFDAGHGRSTHHQMNHNYLGFPGGVPAVKLRELGRAQLAEYPQIDWEHHKVVDCKRDGDEFVAEGQFGTVRARVVINAQELESISRQGMNELLFFRAKVQIGEEVYVVGCNQAVAETFIAAGDDDAGGEFHRVDDESDIPA